MASVSSVNPLSFPTTQLIRPWYRSTHVKMHSLFLPVDRFEHGWAGQIELLSEQIEHGQWAGHGWAYCRSHNNLHISEIQKKPAISFSPKFALQVARINCLVQGIRQRLNIREQPLSIRQAVYNMLKHDWTVMLFHQSCSIMLTGHIPIPLAKYVLRIPSTRQFWPHQPKIAAYGPVM